MDEHSDFWDDVEQDYERKRAAHKLFIRTETANLLSATVIVALVILIFWACGVI